jgi:hypothetical protein
MGALEESKENEGFIASGSVPPTLSFPTHSLADLLGM